MKLFNSICIKTLVCFVSFLRPGSRIKFSTEVQILTSNGRILETMFGFNIKNSARKDSDSDFKTTVKKVPLDKIKY